MENTTQFDLDEIPHGSVVVAFDGSENAQGALQWAAAQARSENRRLVVLQAVEPMGANTRTMLVSTGIHPETLQDQIIGEANEQVAKATEEVLKADPGLEIIRVVRVADPRDLALAAGERADVLVLGSRGRGPMRSLFLGSTSVAVARHATCPVVVVRPDKRPAGTRQGVLVGADGTEQSLPALERAYREASARGLPVTVMHAFWDLVAAGTAAHLVPQEKGQEETEQLQVLLAESVAGFGEKYPDVEVHLQLARGLVEEALSTGAREADLVVVGRHHNGPLRAILRGSVSTAVLEHAQCPVMVVPSEKDQPNTA
ncbi:universal stress protein [Nocardioides sp. zg-DK7169]|uniref:universal stress protein n=1 Tax=Nocardioides sp. zg-DK7169 TaxID=2736600 RepID=UPI001551EB80|nr:universal stress protein [Nocardioides sp. zg-DK7169]NPC96900.1 universal stress protein [Nocardioides sp. zg-DK7169]